MNRVPAFIASVVLATATIIATAPGAHAEAPTPPPPAGPSSLLCDTIPAVWVGGHPMTDPIPYCIPWPF